MKTFRWLTLEETIAIYNDLMEQTGGVKGIRDINLLESALARPQNYLQYQQDEDVFQIAAEYAYGIIRNHPFVDGNKRTAFGVAVVFLYLNGFDVNKEIQNEQELLVQKFAVDESSRNELAQYFKRNSKNLVKLISEVAHSSEKTPEQGKLKAKFTGPKKRR